MCSWKQSSVMQKTNRVQCTWIHLTEHLSNRTLAYLKRKREYSSNIIPYIRNDVVFEYSTITTTARTTTTIIYDSTTTISSNYNLSHTTKHRIQSPHKLKTCFCIFNLMVKIRFACFIKFNQKFVRLMVASEMLVD